MLKKLLVFGLVVGCGQAAWGQSDRPFLTLEGATTEPLTVWVEKSDLSNHPPNGSIDWMFPQVGAGVSALDVRNAWVPEEGIVNDPYGRIRRSHFNGKPAVRWDGSTISDTQDWLSIDGGTSWHLLEPSVGLTFNGLTVTLDSNMTGAPVMQPLGNVPAVGTWGLCVMVLMIVTGGTMVLRQRRSMA